MLMLNAMPEILMFGTSVSSSAPPTRATTYIHYVADVAQQGHQNIGKAVAVAGIEKDLAVYLVEIRLCVFLMAKYLDNFLAGHHFLHERLGLSQRDLLTQKIFGGTVRNGPWLQTPCRQRPTTTIRPRMTL